MRRVMFATPCGRRVHLRTSTGTVIGTASEICCQSAFVNTISRPKDKALHVHVQLSVGVDEYRLGTKQNVHILIPIANSNVVVVELAPQNFEGHVGASLYKTSDPFKNCVENVIVVLLPPIRSNADDISRTRKHVDVTSQTRRHLYYNSDTPRYNNARAPRRDERVVS